jgi:hypothetical protein
LRFEDGVDFQDLFAAIPIPLHVYSGVRIFGDTLVLIAIYPPQANMRRQA